MTATQTPAPSSRVWTVRAGTTGQGMDLFHVYAPTMDTARASVERSAEENWAVGTLVEGGFTVHADAPWRQSDGGTLSGNPVSVIVPAPDFPMEMVDADDVIPSAATHTFV